MRAHLDPTAASLLALTALLGACGPGSETRAAASVVGDAAPARAGNARDPRLAPIVLALEEGFPDTAWTLLDQLGEAAGLDGPLLGARAALLEGDAVGALRELATAHEGWPEEARVFAVEAEVFANMGRARAAEEALSEGRKRGWCAELERARGVLYLTRSGGAAQGLEALELAVALDPELAFTRGPRAAAHVLVGREVLGDAPDEAARHAQAALTLAPTDAEARELLAEARGALLDFEGALALYAELESEGRDLGQTVAFLHQRAATKLLLERRRDEALAHYRAARARGLDELGFGETVMREEAERKIEEGIASYDAGALEEARASFEEALELDPGALEAENHLGVVLFRLEDYAGAARAWEAVLSAARAAERPLPEPVHLNLARAWRLAGQPEKARSVLEEAVRMDPEGPWLEETRALLERLELEEARAPGAPLEGG